MEKLNDPKPSWRGPQCLQGGENSQLHNLCEFGNCSSQGTT